jgi:chromosome segregation ATPase
MPSSISLATTQTPDDSSSERLLKFPARTPSTVVDDISLLDKALAALQHLYQMNNEFAQALERSREAIEGAEAQCKKWEQLATNAMSRAKAAENNQSALQYRANVAEADAKSQREQLAAAKQETMAASKALLAYKDEFSATFRKYGQVHDIINMVNTAGYQHVSGAHFRTVRANAPAADPN